VVKTLFHSLWPNQVIAVPQLGLAQVHCHVVSVFVLFYLFSFSSCLLGPCLSLSLLILSDRFFICPVAEVAVVVVMGLQDVQSQNMCRRKKVFTFKL